MTASKKITGSILVAALLIALAAPASAERGSGRKSLDTDGDGYVSQSEWDAVEHRSGSAFADFDADGDGRISKEEFKNRRRAEGRDRIKERRS